MSAPNDLAEIMAMLTHDDPRIRKMAELAAEGVAAVDRGDFEAAHDVLLRQRAYAVETGSPSDVIATIDEAIRRSGNTIVNENKYGRWFADGRGDLTALGATRFVFELAREDAWPNDPKRRARMWPRVQRFQEYVSGKLVVASALGQTTDIGDVLAAAVDLEIVRTAIRRNTDPIEAVLAAAKDVVH